MLTCTGGNGLTQFARGHAGKWHSRIQMKTSDYTMYKYMYPLTKATIPEERKPYLLKLQVNYCNDLASLKYFPQSRMVPINTIMIKFPVLLNSL